ncbi:hypothetical protein BaRGS_00002795 [Batillaria attramentaria]|uniref:Fe2OG dioxygenase domain-containing protein n=1 Tax=Batillaria attramentaria TaxID=370345 RepID=A0ABD0M481_9CAEN
MAAKGKQTRTFVCSCFFEDNLYIKKYRMHVSYRNKKTFMETCAKELRLRGCVTDAQFAEVIEEIESEISRRRALGEVSLQRRAMITEEYVPLHEDVYQLQESFLDPQFLDLVSDISSVDCLKKQLQEVEFCHRLLEELEHIEQSSCPKGRPNTMNSYGVLLDEYGFDNGLLTPLREIYLMPLTSVLFPDCGGGCLDSHKAFTVIYSTSHDHDLSCHYDNAEVTLNVCLGYEGFTGGDLYFHGMKDEDEWTRQKLHCQHHLGWGILHRGAHMHGADPLISGTRCNLIMWMRASSVRNKQCPMCGQPPKLVEMYGADDGYRLDKGRELEGAKGNEASQSDPVDRDVDVCRLL